jgi:flagellar export protein FliJ
MKTTAKTRDRRLASLERLHELELEQARIERAEVDAAADRQRSRVAALEREVEEMHEMERARIASQSGVSVEFLRGTRAYARWQHQEIGKERGALKSAEQLAEQARLKVTQRFERLEVIGRLRARGARDAAMEQGRSEQKTLDDLALVRGRMDFERR